jgi:hypothetical protein
MPGRREVLLTDKQWENVKQFIPMVEHPKLVRPRTDDCVALWASCGTSKARWKISPARLPSPSTC